MIKLLIGGSPCTFWSIAQKNNRETEPSGLGWELFENYLIAKEKFKPDIFLYENNKSAAKAIKDEIKKKFNVWDGTLLMQDSGVRYIEINSALVSAQNRQRFYVHNCGEVGQPEDRGILLRDILESGQGWTEKGYALTTRCVGAIPEDTLKRKRHTMVAENVIFQTPRGKNKGGCKYEKSPTLTANGCWEHNNKVIEQVAEPVCLNSKSGRVINGKFVSDKQPSLQDRIYTTEGKATAVTTSFLPKIAEPVRIGDMGSKAQAHRIYSIDGKSICINSGGGGLGAKTGLYAVPKYLNDKNMEHLMRPFGAKGKIVSDETEKSPTLLAASGAGGGNAIYYAEHIDGKTYPVYEVRDGMITIKGNKYPIKLKDGCYIIRKLTVTECCRLQTMPDDYCRAVSNTQAYRGLGNGWTADVIIHILNGALKNIPKYEKILVLSMYDGIGTGRYCLDKMGFTNVEYHAYEIDKYAMQIAMSNYPDIIQHGDAFEIRNKNYIL